MCVASIIVGSANGALADLTLEKVVLVSRHGVRSPTGTAASLSQIARQARPSWPVPPGYLTPRGEALASLMGGYYRNLYTTRGLFAADPCPPPNAVFVRADVDQRTRLTARGLLSGMLPGCDLVPSHGPIDDPDPDLSSGPGRRLQDRSRAFARGRDGTGGRRPRQGRAVASKIVAEDAIRSGMLRTEALRHQCQKLHLGDAVIDP